MIARISIFLLAAGTAFADPDKSSKDKNPISLLPNGSSLKGVLLPRYDENRKLVGDLKAETMTIIDANRIQGENVSVRFYNPNQTQRGLVKLKNATFDQQAALLEAEESVEITYDKLIANGTGLIYAFQTGKGFLVGPASTTISIPQNTTSMNTNPLHKSMMLLLCLAPASPIYSAPPPFLTEAEIEAIHAQAKSLAPQAEAANESANKQLAQDTEIAEKAVEAALTFINSSNTKTIQREKDPELPTEPLKVEPDPESTVINCKGGMYFDAEEGVLVYLDGVTVADPRFTLTGAKELKVFFDKKEPAKADEKKEPKENPEDIQGLGPNANFGDVRKIVANGAVRILQKSVDGKKPVEASGAILTYDIKKGEIIISGGYPWVKQDTFYARAKQPNLTLQLWNNGEFSTQGDWEMGGNLKLDGR